MQSALRARSQQALRHLHVMLHIFDGVRAVIERFTFVPAPPSPHTRRFCPAQYLSPDG
ncbi:hypothetical protein RALTA_A1559 [Cupriavidus taiwanensis LMG 19424]|uniref:Uncharacterized protein n=1 Tax=Cupriavidus taiwanensis (strain DSM 17343 / BCRC 17206 / CCUG 44338 / CIP 107171 / LMG 19424 / R1) TaxID=977880 RepID=B3R196_CUPTR|nr:hypothetical protein RALTA_A1559 [Cupriavidus taiwanensis LMG 19424]